MESRNKYAAMLIPLSMMLLSVLRCGQYISEHSDILNWKPFRASNSVLLDPASYNCIHSYSIELLSIDPLVIYLNNFLSDVEVDYLLGLGKDEFKESPISYGDGPLLDQTIRSSKTAYLPEDDIVCDCLAQRMQSLLGNIQHTRIESLQIVKYTGDDTFKFHLDWFSKPNNEIIDDGGMVRQRNRLGTIFAYLDDNCTRGETYFPDLPSVSISADSEKYALPENGTGLLVKPRRGNAVFWNNLLPDGTGDERLLHAGLPVHSGAKVGLNMWSYYFYDLPMVGGP
ncbi:2OG-Fe(II) oxygenase family oxidoreductase [Xylariaceae sp. AK1471]|nr:2OG-Fe(II) oxygenase family oxidoreductase [Xylariaceae sp. AK1471]